MTNKIFGQEAPEQREARLNLLEELIAEGEEAVKDRTAESEWVADESSWKLVFIDDDDDDDALFHIPFYREYVERAWADVLRFKEQKDKDLEEALINYAHMQISMCKKVPICQFSEVENMDRK